MLLKVVITLALMALMAPREPGVGLGRPSGFSQIEIERAQTALIETIERVRADLNPSTRSSIKPKIASPPFFVANKSH